MLETITLMEAAKLLGYKDCRSVLRWCRINNVTIIFNKHCNKKCIVRLQFDGVRLKEFIQYLKRTFNDKWLDAFQAYASNNIVHVFELNQNITLNKKPNTTTYSPLGDREKLFLSTLTKQVQEE